ncbi:hypothetical protein QCA50_007850 [Cerrena zonata]|uniref:Methyltransferase domain-containing protein n=1 Tax=Cerrena zonata TaxID=2478898 RepID=A0AAW0GBY4_9APHY
MMLWGLEQPPYPFRESPMLQFDIPRKPFNRKKIARKQEPESPFRYQHGSKLHNYSVEDVPYPLSYDRETLDLSVIDHALIQKVKNGELTMRKLKGNVPSRCLDVGTALGDWVLGCAVKWTECTFVGFDLADIQIPLKYADPSIAGRVQWVHGNFLKYPWPFADDEFDYIHVEGVGFGIPETKWQGFLDEIHRVLKPGGTVEILQEDAVFPVLPKWFTRPLHADKSSPMPPPTNGSSSPTTPTFPLPDDHPHDYTLLEHLYYSVFESRFINPKPTSILPVYFFATFKHVVSPPLLYFPVPPMAPLTPLAGEPPICISSCTITSDPSDPTRFFLPVPCSPPVEDTHSMDSSTLASYFSITSDKFSPSSETPSSSRTSLSSVTPTILQRIPSGISIHNDVPSTSKTPMPPSTYLFSHMAGSNVLGGEATVTELFPAREFTMLEDKSLYMQLYRAAGTVYGVKEAMWDELKKILVRGDPFLQLYGWEDDDYRYEHLSRMRFDTMFQRYREDMHVRISLWHSVAKAGWVLPRKDRPHSARTCRGAGVT